MEMAGSNSTVLTSSDFKGSYEHRRNKMATVLGKAIAAFHRTPIHIQKGYDPYAVNLGELFATKGEPRYTSDAAEQLHKAHQEAWNTFKDHETTLEIIRMQRSQNKEPIDDNVPRRTRY